MSSIIKPDSTLIAWLDKYIVDLIVINEKWWPLPRVFGVDIISYRPTIDGKTWTLVSFWFPALNGDGWLFVNSLISFRLHLPFCISLSLRLPVKFKGYWWGWTLQTILGWKPYNGRLTATFRVQNDEHADYNNPTGAVGRAKGLEEGYI